MGEGEPRLTRRFPPSPPRCPAPNTALGRLQNLQNLQNRRRLVGIRFPQVGGQTEEETTKNFHVEALFSCFHEISDSLGGEKNF